MVSIVSWRRLTFTSAAFVVTGRTFERAGGVSFFLRTRDNGALPQRGGDHGADRGRVQVFRAGPEERQHDRDPPHEEADPAAARHAPEQHPAYGAERQDRVRDRRRPLRNGREGGVWTLQERQRTGSL